MNCMTPSVEKEVSVLVEPRFQLQFVAAKSMLVGGFS